MLKRINDRLFRQKKKLMETLKLKTGTEIKNSTDGPNRSDPAKERLSYPDNP